MLKVVKFGGSSLADANQFKKVYNIVKSDESRQYVVPSAPGKRFPEDVKVTDLLYKCYNLALSKQNFKDTFDIIKDRYRSIISDLELDLSLEDEFSEIENELIDGTSGDYVASRGEYLN